MLQYSRLGILTYWLYGYKQKDQICKTLNAYLWSCIKGPIAKSNRVKLDLGTPQCSILLCSVLSLHRNCWPCVGTQLEDADMISSLAFLPIITADRFIMGFLHSIPVRKSKMNDQKSLTLCWHSFWDMVSILSQAFWRSKAADSSVMNQ